jgi:hypothetical protein
MTTEAKQEQTREIKNLGVLDLTGMKSPDELSNISAIKNVGVILAPQSLMTKLTSIPMENIGHTVPIPDGKNIKVSTVMGPFQTSGEGLVPPEAGSETEYALAVMGPFTVTSPIQKIGYTYMTVMGPVTAPKGSEAALASTNIRVMGPIRFYPTGDNIKVQFGNLKLSGKALSTPPDDGKDTLVVVGDLLITTPVDEKLGYKRVVVIGNSLAPKQSEDVLGPHLDVDGSTVWYSATPRVFEGQDRFSAAFFDLLKEPITMILNGQFSIEADVTVESFREKVAEIILNGMLEGPKHLVPLMQVLATQKNGLIQVSSEGGGDRGSHQ